MNPTSYPYSIPIIVLTTGTNTIQSTDSPNLFITPVPYVIPNHSPSVPYILQYFILDTIFFPPAYYQCPIPIIVWKQKLWLLLSPNSDSIINYNYIFHSRLFFQARFYTTAKFTSLLIYPTFPSLIQYQLQLYTTSPIVEITNGSHSFPFRYQINRPAFLLSCAILNTDSKKNSHIQTKYCTTYQIIHFCLFSLLYHVSYAVHFPLNSYINRYAHIRTHSLPSRMTWGITT